MNVNEITTDFEEIKLNVFNIWGQIIESGLIYFDIKNSFIKTNKGEIFKVVKNNEFTYQVDKKNKTIESYNGIKGLLEFIQENNSSEGVFNFSRISFFINL